MAPPSYLMVRVTPRASRDELTGWRAGILQVRLRAPPVDGKANEALRRLIADRLNITHTQIEIVSGASARTKRLQIEGLGSEEVAHRLNAPAL